jgi:phosphonate transport system ATP-binding protein
MVALIGASGSGKSTLIRALAGLVAIEKAPAGNGRDGSGTIVMFGRPIQRDGRIVRGAKDLRVRVGVIFQQFNLVPRLSVLTNVCLGLLGRMPFMRGTLSNVTMDEKRRAMHALTRVDMAEHALKRGATFGRPAAARGHRPHACAGRRTPDRRRADRFTRPGLGAPRHGYSCRDEPSGWDHDPDLAAPGRVRPELALKAGKIVYDGPSDELTPELLSSIYGAEGGELFLRGFDHTAVPLALASRREAEPAALRVAQM